MVDGVDGAGQWLEAVLDAERRGELLTAFDLAERALEQHPGDRALQYRAVLALARVGSTEEAARRYSEFGLGSVASEDVAALGARIAKDRALAASSPHRAGLAAVSADLYAGVFQVTGGYYPAINAATMSLIAGDGAAARELATHALQLSVEDDYYAVATRAEARLLLGDRDAAATELQRAGELHDGDWSALASTRRQLALICDVMGEGSDVLGALPSPAVVHFCGHRIATPRFGSDSEAGIAAKISAELERAPVDYAYGALASGADILWAEALLRIDAELHVVLPCAASGFVASSVAHAGSGWPTRFDRCLAAAASVRFVTEDAVIVDDVLYRYGSELAMGLALLRARNVGAKVRQLAVWDGKPAAGGAGTAIDVMTWRNRGLETTVIEPPPAMDVSDQPDVATASERVVRAMLFADFKGFSKLADDQVPIFTTELMGALGRVLKAYGSAVELRETAGDGLYAVLNDAPTAAACAVDLQRELGAVDLSAVGLPNSLSLRLGAHVGPVFRMEDPVVQRLSFVGSHVSRTARIEPVTPPGTVYVTEPFAAALELAGCDDYACDYVGHMAAAKDYGRLRMYRLRAA